MNVIFDTLITSPTKRHQVSSENNACVNSTQYAHGQSNLIDIYKENCLFCFFFSLVTSHQIFQ